MKKNTTTLLIVGALAVGGYLAYKKGLFGKKSAETDETPDEAPEGEGEPASKGGGGTPAQKGVTAILDIATSGKPLSDAIVKAKGIVEDYKAGRVIIKTEKGKKNISVTRKAKQTERKATVKAKRTERKATVKAKRTERKAKRTERKASRKAKTVGYSF